MKHNHDVLMAINSRIINGRSSGAKQLNADYRALVKARDEILKLRAALEAKGVPEPDFGNMEQPAVKTYSGGKAWHVAPTKREWVGLTTDEIQRLDISAQTMKIAMHDVAVIEAILKEKNT